MATYTMYFLQVWQTANSFKIMISFEKLLELLNVVVTKEKISGNKRTSQSCMQNMDKLSFQNVGG